MDAPALPYESQPQQNADGVRLTEAPPDPAPDPAGLAGVLSLLGMDDTPPAAEDAAPDGERALLSALRVCLTDTRVLSVDRTVRMLDTARSIRGILHTFGPLLGELLGGKR